MPKFSIVTPVYNPPLWALEACIQSVKQQTFTDWEWCIADDCSTDPKVLEILTSLADSEPRVKLIQREVNSGIVDASNSAIGEATGEFIALLDHDDSLTPHALETVAQQIDLNPEVDYLYSDEDKVNEKGTFFDTFHKPDFSPERLRGQNYCCHLSIFRSSLLDKIGSFRSGFEGSQDYDLILRATEQARSIVHIPEVLYHWRVVTGSTAGVSDAKPYAFEAARRAVEEHCSRIGVDADVTSTDFGYVRVNRKVISQPKVSIVIPTRGDRQRIWGIDTCLAANAIKSIFTKSTYSNLEIVLVHDFVKVLEPEIKALVSDERLNLVWYHKPFDFSEKCNLGVTKATGEIIVLLNDDTEICTPEWIEVLVGFLQDDEVAMAGLLTMLEDGRIQSAGHGNNPLPHNLAAGEPITSGGYFGERLISREISGVTGACLAITRHRYFELGGMSVAFPHSFNDVDFAYKALEIGLRLIWTPNAKIWHFESLSRDPTVREEEFEAMRSRWGRYFGRDRFTRHEF